MGMDSSSITTELYMHFIRCKKAGYLNKYHSDRKSTYAEDRIDISHFKEICNNLLVQEEKQTGVNIIFKKEFKYEEVIISPDAIITDSNRCILIKFKYSTFYTSQLDYDELAFNAYILKTHNILITEYWIFSIDEKYVQENSLNKKFLNVVRCNSNKVIKKMRSVLSNLKLLKDTLSKTEIPFENLSDKCRKCEFLSVCNPYAKSTLNLTEMKWRKKLSLSWKNCIDLTNMPDDVNFTKAQWKEIELLTSKDIVVEKVKIKGYLNSIKSERNLIYLNMTGIHAHMPVFEGSKPFNMVFFQYSLFCGRELEKGGSLLYEKLNTKPLNHIETKRFFENFLFEISLNNATTIVVYDKKRAEEMLDSILYLIPRKKDEITAIKGRLFDLRELFSNKWYLNPKLNGSTLIEDILQDMSPKLDWKILTETNFNALRKKIVYSEKFSDSDKIVLKKISNLFVYGLSATTNHLKKLVGFKS